MGKVTVTKRSPEGSGQPAWVMFVVALAGSMAAAAVDLAWHGAIGVFYQAGYVLSCVVAVLLVRPYSLFVPMTQPPLILVLASTITVVVGAGAQLDTTGAALAAARPLIGSFPVMIGATILTLLLGGVRILRRRRAVVAAG